MSNLIGTVWVTTASAVEKGQAMLDARIPPAKRQDFYDKTLEFVQLNPKLSAFILINFLCSCIPIALFITFIGTVFACILIAVFSTLAFTFTLALAFLLPTLFFTTITALSCWCFALLAFSIFSRARGSPPPVQHKSKQKSSKTNLLKASEIPTRNGTNNHPPHESRNLENSPDIDYARDGYATPVPEKGTLTDAPFQLDPSKRNEGNHVKLVDNGQAN